MESEINLSKFATLSKLSSGKSYSNSAIENLNVETNDEDVYNIDLTATRKIEIFKSLNFTIGNFG